MSAKSLGVPDGPVVTDTYEYDAYGNEINSTGSTPNVFLYRGEAYDSDLGLYYLRARWMNRLTGRFMSRDPNEPKLIDTHRVPLDPKVRHKYIYAGGDPVNMIDPTGKGFIEDLLIEGQEKAAGLWALARTEASLVALFACVDDVIEDAFDIDAAFEFCLENPE